MKRALPQIFQLETINSNSWFYWKLKTEKNKVINNIERATSAKFPTLNPKFKFLFLFYFRIEKKPDQYKGGAREIFHP